jgi:hypothetical protein
VSDLLVSARRSQETHTRRWLAKPSTQSSRHATAKTIMAKSAGPRPMTSCEGDAGEVVDAAVMPAWWANSKSAAERRKTVLASKSIASAIRIETVAFLSCGWRLFVRHREETGVMQIALPLVSRSLPSTFLERC